MPRFFVAIDPPESLCRGVESICNGLPAETRWTPLEQLHLTLRFIGEVDNHLALQIKKALSGIHFTSFLLQIKGLGCFPDRRQPKIIWAGVAENPNLERLHDLVESCLVQLGLTPEDRKYHPHITLARFPSRVPLEILDAYIAKNSQASSTPFRVDSFHLYTSLLTSHGALHHIEGTFCAR